MEKVKEEGVDKKMKNTTRHAIGIAIIILIALVSWALVDTVGKEKYSNLGIEEYEKGNYDKAIEYFTMAIELTPNNAIAYHNRGLAYLKTGSKYTPEGKASLEKAISDYSKAVELKPDYVEAYYHRGVARIEFIHFYDKPFSQAENEMFNEGLNDFNKALELDGTFYLSYSGMGNAYDRYGEFDEAVKWYNKALDNENKILQKRGKEALAGIYYSRGRAYQRVEDPQAIQDYEKSLEYDPNFDITLGHLASIYSSIGKYEDALELYDRSVDIKESQPVLGLWDFHTWDGRGVCYYKLGEYDKAIQDLNKAIEVGRRPILPAYLYLGKTFLAMEDDTKAGEYFEEVTGICTDAIEKIEKGEQVWLYPSEVYALYNIRGLAYIEFEEYDKAISDFERVVQLSPDFPRGHTYYYVDGRKNIGIAYSKMGDKEKAKEFYQEALSMAEGRGLQFTKEEIEKLLKEL